ncbi:MAG: hypothetical protein M3Y33_00555 [Actinomycetota bacterium]|nr:hypothetical protein [Actinomycetota bacterium]
MTKKRENVRNSARGKMAYWLMTPGGILMPAAIPAEHAAQYPPGTLQVRARDAAHLDWLRTHYCPELGQTAATPEKDYDCRAYVLADALARAVARMTLDIDAAKFKPLTGGPLGLKSAKKRADLHSCYLSIWGAVTRLSAKPWSSYITPTKSTYKPDASRCPEEGHFYPSWSREKCADCGMARQWVSA